jgi:D-alanyl-D-alanine carboxypeptidase/D-alanyl-D-alanine-endopeptidase (penicillin-binding protein 4)
MTTHIPAFRREEPPDDLDEEHGDEPRRKRGKKGLFITLGAVVVVIAVAAGLVIGSSSVRQTLGLATVADTSTAAPPAPIQVAPALHPPNGQASTPAGVAAVLDPQTGNSGLGTMTGTVLDATTGTVLWNHNASAAMTPASTNKLLTCTAALLVLDPQNTLSTTVVAGSDPGTIVLVGGGDPTLSSLPDGKETVYPGAAHISDLAAQVKQHMSGQITRILVDTSQYSGPTMAPGWDPSDVAGGNFAPLQSLMINGGRSDASNPKTNPNNPDSPRSENPAQDAGVALAKALGVSQSAVSAGTAGAGAQVLGTVHSATIQDLIANLLQISDNVLAEAIGRQVAKADGQPESFAGAVTAIHDVLQRNGFDASGMNTSDSSGLSTLDKVPAALLASAVRTAAAPDGADPRTAKLRPLLAGLPVGGGSGTLAGRYQTGSAAAGKGWVRAKTGTLGSLGVNALAGVVVDEDNRVLVFALMSNGGLAEAADLLDGMAASLRGCGCR